MDAHSGGMSGSTSNSQRINMSPDSTIHQIPPPSYSHSYSHNRNRIIAASLGLTFAVLLSLAIAISLTRRYRAARNANANLDVEIVAEASKAVEEHPPAKQESQNESPFADPLPIHPRFVYGRWRWQWRWQWRRNPFHDRNAVALGALPASGSS